MPVGVERVLQDGTHARIECAQLHVQIRMVVQGLAQRGYRHPRGLFMGVTVDPATDGREDDGAKPMCSG